MHVEEDRVPAVFMLTRKVPRNNIIVGDDAAQVRFVEQRTGMAAERVDRVTDDLLVGRNGVLYHVRADYLLDVSPETRGKTGIWAAVPIVKGSTAVNTLVKFAATLLGGSEKKLSKDTVNKVGDLLTRERIEDVRGAIWKAVWLLSAELPAWKPWPNPWEAPVAWLDSSMPVTQRLHQLYKDVRGYCELLQGEEAARAFGLKPHAIQKLKGLTLDPTRVANTLSLLSRWKQGRIPPYICALQISAVWQFQ